MIPEKGRDRLCKNCPDRVHTPDSRTGIIHTSGKYVCENPYKEIENNKGVAA